MSTQSQLLDSFEPLYNQYNHTIKPLIAEIEIRYESFPTPIFNEIRAFNDHIARCYMEPNNNELVDIQVRKAKGHIERMILDCYKFLNVSMYDSVIKGFDKKYKGVDLSIIGNGDFFVEYKKTKKEIILLLKDAKSKEQLENKDCSIKLYEKAHNRYTDLENLILDNISNLFWAKNKYCVKKILRILGWLLSAIISGFVSTSLLPYEKMIEWIKNII